MEDHGRGKRAVTRGINRTHAIGELLGKRKKARCHTRVEIMARKLKAVLGYEPPEERIIQVGAAIGSHIGPNGCGMVYVGE